MTPQTEIIEMARQAGLHLVGTEHNQAYTEVIEAFAKLVAAAAVSKEREACAQVCDEYIAVGKIEEFDRGWLTCARTIASVIRARGEA